MYRKQQMTPALRLTPMLRLLFILCNALLAPAAHAQSLEVIDLHYRMADEVIPILQPLLEPGGAITGKDTKLFIRTGAANLAEVRGALAAIDKAPRQLRVFVRRSTQQEIEREGVSVAGTVRGTNASVSVNEPPRDASGVSVRATQSNETRSGNGIAMVQVLEGDSAFISSGETTPVVTAVAGGAGRRRGWSAAALEYRNLSSGFLVRPRLAGDRVIVEISQHSATQSDRDSGRVDTQALETQASARPGEWMRLGGVEEMSSSRDRGLATRQYTTASDTLSLWVKVEVAD